MTDRVIAFILLIALLAAIVCIFLVVVEGVRSRRARRIEAQVKSASEQLLAAISDEVLVPSAARAFGELPLVPAASQLSAIAETVTGPELRRTVLVAEQAGVQRRLDGCCRDSKWSQRLFGVRMLARLGIEEKLLLDLMRDRNGAVRASAAGAASSDSSPAVVRQLLVLLDDPDPLVRVSAQGALFASGPAASTGELLTYLSDPTSPRLAAALEVARTRAEPTFLQPALALASHGMSPEGIRERERAATGEDRPDAGSKADGAWSDAAAVRAAAAQVLGALQGQAAAAALGESLGDPHPSVRIAAAEGLGKLGAVGNAAGLERTLDDPVWDVRRAAAEALRQMGPLGRMHLRSARRRGGPVAAAMARTALEVPAAPVGAGQGT